MDNFFNSVYRDNKRIAIICVVISAFQSFALFQADTRFANGALVLPSFIITIVLVAVLLFSNSKGFRINSSSVLLILSVFFWWLLESIIHNYNDDFAYFSIINPFILVIFILLNDYSKRAAYDLFYDSFFFISIFGIIAYLLDTFNFIPPFSIVDFYEEDASAVYDNYGLAYVFDPMSVVGFKRLCGLFNEPGFFGTLGAFLLIIDNLKVKAKNVVIFIACMMSFSVAFYSIIFIYLIIKIVLTRNLKLLFIFIPILAVVVYIFSGDIIDDNIASFFNRFVFEDGSLNGDHRASSWDASVWNTVVNNPEMLWFGYGKMYLYEGSSYQSIIIKHGIFGAFLIFVPLLMACLKIAGRNKLCIAFIVCFMISLYQRTQIFNVAYFLVLLGGLQYIKTRQQTI